MPMTQTQFSTGEMIIVSEQDEQKLGCSLTACGVANIEETPPTRFRDLQYQLWAVNKPLRGLLKR